MWTKHGFRTTRARSELMRNIKSKNTSPELVFKSLLRQSRIHFTTVNDKLPGKPDFVLKSYPIVIFIDGEFWHGYKWRRKKLSIKTNRSYWISKIEGNMVRDKKNNRLLKKGGWKVIRFWESQIKNDLCTCLEIIKKEQLSCFK